MARTGAVVRVGGRRRRLAREGPVGRPYPSAVRLNDLTRNGKSEPGILSEALARAIGVEALENALEGVRRDSRAVVVDRDDDLIARRLAVRRVSPRARLSAIRTSPPAGENEQALSIKLVITWASRES